MKQVGKRKPFQWIEFSFDGAYLAFAAVSALVFLIAADGRASVTVFGITVALLAIGDSFHLIPRMISIAKKDSLRYLRAMGLGKLITSLTMTVFYVLLSGFASLLYPSIKIPVLIFALVLILATVRIALCLFPQNRFISGGGNAVWPIARNIPFLLLGIVVAALFIRSGQIYPDAFSQMPVAIFLSFAFYLPVALFSNKLPALGALMLPKTAMYVWIICMGFTLLV